MPMTFISYRHFFYSSFLKYSIPSIKNPINRSIIEKMVNIKKSRARNIFKPLILFDFYYFSVAMISFLL